MQRLDAPWLNAHHCKRAVEALGKDHVRFVGGAVRNTLMGLPVSDIDAATDHLPEEAMRLLRDNGFNVIPTGIDHGTLTAVLEGDVLEVTTLRHDIETDGRRAKVAFTNEWEGDAARRDFTVNAIYLSDDGTLYDPFDGQADIKAGHIHFIGSAENRIREDALRILRLFRFQAHYGRVPLDISAINAVEKTVGLIDSLSVERIASELHKLIRALTPVPVLKLMDHLGLLEHCMPECSFNLDKIKALVEEDRHYQDETKALRRLLALTGDHTSSLLKYWNCSKRDQKHAKWCEEIFSEIAGKQLDLIDWQKLIFRYNHEAVIDSYLISRVGDINPDIIEQLKDWDIPIFPISGSDMMDRGFEPGPELGSMMKAMEDYWIEEGFHPSPDQLFAKLNQLS